MRQVPVIITVGNNGNNFTPVILISCPQGSCYTPSQTTPDSVFPAKYKFPLGHYTSTFISLQSSGRYACYRSRLNPRSLIIQICFMSVLTNSKFKRTGFFCIRIVFTTQNCALCTLGKGLIKDLEQICLIVTGPNPQIQRVEA